MSARSIGSGSITFGLVSIPVKLYTAVSSKQIGFNLFHEKKKDGTACGSRVQQLLQCEQEKELIVDRRSELVRGYEHTRGQFVIFTAEEIKSLEASRPSVLEVLEFVPEESVDLLYVEKSKYLGPDKGGDRAYRLLVEAMVEQRVMAIGRFAQHGKDNLVAVRPYKGGLLLHELYYATEVHAFDEVHLGAPSEVKPVERELAGQLIKRLRSDRFDASKYRDEYAAKVEELVAKKVAGEEIVIPAAPKQNIVDLLEALQKSVAGAEVKVANANAELAAARSSGKGPKKAVPRKTEAKKSRRRGADAN